MSPLPILEYPDPRLRTKAQPVTVFDAALQALVDDMFATMYEAPGIGLAASQVNVHKQLLVLDVSEEKNAPTTRPWDRDASGKRPWERSSVTK